MQENYENVTSLGFPVSKPYVISQLEGGEELWVLDLPGLEKSEILRSPCTAGDGVVRESKEQNPHQEDAELAEAHGALLQRSKGSVSSSLPCGQEEVCGSCQYKDQIVGIRRSSKKHNHQINLHESVARLINARAPTY
ncbi:zinc finger protein 7-like [Mauremys reevesii]|uniref:zinc finger protein 7-like n=1 Tax=Mauremys reevesii TaxID=260615 RepID=UPI00193F532D|nr:zinc finger protein 7-like [Mauremys reevesii]